MDERSRPSTSVEEYLQDTDVQKRIIKSMHRVHSQATVTIGKVASLFNFTENQLRDWEDRGLLKPIRHSGGQRQYSYTELDKLAVIRELMDARYAPGDIPAHIDEIWNTATILKPRPGSSVYGSEVQFHDEGTVEETAERIRQQEFWRFFVSRVLRLSHSLICENSGTATGGIILPLEEQDSLPAELSPKDLPRVGAALIGWSDRAGLFSAFLDPLPSFEYPSDFRLQRLQSNKEHGQRATAFIVVPRNMQLLNLGDGVVKVVLRLLSLIYEHKSEWEAAFRQGMYDVTLSRTDVRSSAYSPDTLLQKITEMAVELGGYEPVDRPRWRYSCFLQPKDSIVPLHQRDLVVQAKSKYCPFKVGVDPFYAFDASHRFSLRAFQSGYTVCHPGIPEQGSAAIEGEDAVYPQLAVPIGAELGSPLGVLYVVADHSNTFDEDDQRALRLLGRIVEELLRAYAVSRQVMYGLTDIIEKPDLVDKAFADFASETEFMHDFEQILFDIKRRAEDLSSQQETDATSETDAQHHLSAEEELNKEWVSCIAIDIDNQGRVANKYGDLMARNLSREVGLRVQGQFHASIRKPETCKLYHVYGDRFYVLMRGIDPKQALQDALRLREALSGSYQIDGLRSFIEQPTLPDGMSVLSDITVRIASTSYKYGRLLRILKGFAKGGSDAAAIVEVREKVSSTLDDVLKMGMDMGGNVVLAWDHDLRRFVAYSSKEVAQQGPSTNEELVSV